MPSRARPPAYGCSIAILLPFLAVVTLLDAFCFFELWYPLPWLVTGFYFFLVGVLLWNLAWWLVAALSLPFFAAVVALEDSYFQSWPPLRWLVPALYLALASLLVRDRASRVIAGVSTIWLLIVLPQVRWNHVKSFYIDARQLALGMTSAEVRGIMAPYLERDPSMVSVGPDPAGETSLIYLYSANEDGYCRVSFDSRGRARDINIRGLD